MTKNVVGWINLEAFKKFTTERPKKIIASCKLALKREGGGLGKKGPIESWQFVTFWQFAKIQQLLSKILQVANW